jgi:hypothetical protein
MLPAFRLANDPDFICSKRFDFSLAKLLERYPGGAPDSVIAQALGIPEEQVESRWARVVGILRRDVGAA